MKLDPQHVAIGVAIAGLVVVPAVVALTKRLLQAWHEARYGRLAKVFATREEVEMNFDELRKVQERQHAENRDFLDTIRTEALAREGRLTAILETYRQEQRTDTKDVREEVGEVHKRVDSVLGMLGNRRR